MTFVRPVFSAFKGFNQVQGASPEKLAGFSLEGPMPFIATLCGIRL